MGKGGYLGGGTIIGPHTPDWFGHGDAAKGSAQADSQQQKPFVPAKFQKAEALWQQEFEKPAAVAPAPARRRELSTREAAGLSNLRIAVKASRQQLAAAEARLKADLEALNNRLAELGQPLED